MSTARIIAKEDQTASQQRPALIRVNLFEQSHSSLMSLEKTGGNHYLLLEKDNLAQ